MKEHPLLADVRRERTIAVIRTASTESAVQLGLACLRAGVSLLEVTFTVPDALAAVRELARAEGATVGVGTVLRPEQAYAAARAGARFGISPHFDPEVIAAEKAEGLLSIAAGLTPTELVAAHRAGADLVKLYPAVSVGGPAYVRIIREPLPFLPLLCNGGVDASNAAAFIEAGAVGVGIGAAALARAAVAAGDWGAVESTVKRVADAARAAQGPAA